MCNVVYVGGEGEIGALIRQYVSEAVLIEDEGTEVTYHLPGDITHTTAYGCLFDALDANITRLGISSYGISDTTLEEVSCYNMLSKLYQYLIILFFHLMVIPLFLVLFF